ncbi:MAG: LiaI-LiaF-like domain-containing protein, partial [Bryobacteraceae bacterium]
MRRGSIIAPLVLIALGLLFLARNLYPEIPLLEYFSRYWPLVLIVWGVLRLAEVLFWASTRRPLPRTGVSRGEWLLVILLCIAGAGVHTARAAAPWWPRARIAGGGLDIFGESHDYPVSGQAQTSSAPKVVIESFRGAARITGANTDSVAVTGHRSIRSFDQRAADRANENTPFQVTSNGDLITIRTNQEGFRGNFRVTSDLEITVPKGATIEANGRNGDFDVNGVAGVDLASENADVRLQNIAGDVVLRGSRAVHA